MYHDIVSQCAGTLRLVDAWLDKAEEHAADRKFDTDVLASARLAPDMAPLAYQVTSACDYVKAGARLAGVAPPLHDDTETTFPELRARVAGSLRLLRREHGSSADEHLGHLVRDSAKRLRGPRCPKRDLGAREPARGKRSRKWNGVLGIVDHDDGNDARFAQARERFVDRRQRVGHVSANTVNGRRVS